MLTARNITDDEKQFLLNLSSTRLSNEVIVRMFNYWCDKETKENHPPMFQTFDKLIVNPGDLECIHNTFETTVGSFILNKYLIDGTGLAPHISYLNDEMNGKDLSKLSDRVAHLYLLDKIDTNVVNNYITMRDSFLSMIYQAILPSLSANILIVQPEIEKRKDELVKKYAKEIEDGDLVTMNKIQDELVNYAKDLLQDDESMILYQSGGKPVFSNNYKVLSIMRGPIKNEVTGKYEFVTSNLMNGIRKEDIPTSANTILASEYPTAIATASAGYLSKKILYYMQGETIGEKGSDCGSKATLRMVATKSLANEYRYFVKNGKLHLLTPDNIDQYEGQILDFRSPMCCTRDGGPCNICAGEYSYMVGIKNIGLLANKISGSILNNLTKSKHDLSYKTTQIQIID